MSVFHQQKAKHRQESAEQQKTLFDKFGKARRPELVKSPDCLPARWRKFWEKYVIDTNTKLVSRAEIEKTALAATLQAWRKEISRRDMRVNHPKLFGEAA